LYAASENGLAERLRVLSRVRQGEADLRCRVLPYAPGLPWAQLRRNRLSDSDPFRVGRCRAAGDLRRMGLTSVQPR
jgi:hypothetical protein